MIATHDMLLKSHASTVLARIEGAGGEGYVPRPDESLAAMFLHRERLVYRIAEYQDRTEGQGVRWRYFDPLDPDGG